MAATCFNLPHARIICSKFVLSKLKTCFKQILRRTKYVALRQEKICNVILVTRSRNLMSSDSDLEDALSALSRARECKYQEINLFLN